MDAPDYDLALLVPRDMYAADARKALTAVELAVRPVPNEPIDRLAMDRLIRQVATEQGIDPHLLFQMLRVALRGNLASPGLYDTMTALGRDGVRERIADALTRLTDVAATPN
jgi:glutamyl-tRNA synthetase